MASAQEVQDEIFGVNPPANHHDVVVHRNGPIARIARTVQDKISTAVAEVTLWLPRRTLKDNDLGVNKPRKVDTTLGHAIDAASFGRVNYIVLSRIVDALNTQGAKIDISDLLSE